MEAKDIIEKLKPHAKKLGIGMKSKHMMALRKAMKKNPDKSIAQLEKMVSDDEKKKREKRDEITKKKAKATAKALESSKKSRAKTYGK
tara:strand:+ start:3309 stop:3572 length:264 start_codon:yes stop_codon:yes gene_type:complete